MIAPTTIRLQNVNFFGIPVPQQRTPRASVISPPRERRRLAVAASRTLVVVASHTPDTVVVAA